MQRTRIKICGVSDSETALVAVEAGADAIGFVFVPESPRHISSEQAQAILRALPPLVEPIGLFVNASLAQVRQTTLAVGLRTVQLHGDESPDYVTALAPLRVIKAIGFNPATAAAALKPWRGATNLAAILLDAPVTPKATGATLPGGSGKTFDWEALADLRQGVLFAGLPPLIVAGGLTKSNVGRAIGLVHPYGVDVSSGVESSRGVKDPQRILDFCRAVYHADIARRDMASGLQMHI